MSETEATVQIPDERLDGFASRLKGAVVVITGGANGIGKETALRCAKHGAKIVIGDLDMKGAEQTRQEIEGGGGHALVMRCDVTVWEDQVALFDAALSTFKAIDVVVANAGVNEHFGLGELQFDPDTGKAKRPDLLTTEVNIVGVMYTTHLAVHYLRETAGDGALKSLIYLASMAGLITLGGAPQYTASKHAVLGLMRAIAWPNAKLGIKVAAVTPWFVATGILAPATRALLTGLPLAPVDRVAGAIVYAATEPDVQETGGCVYALIDGKSAVTRFPKTSTVPGIYGELEARIDALFGLETIVRQAPKWFKRIGVPLALVAAVWVAQAKLLSS